MFALKTAAAVIASLALVGIAAVPANAFTIPAPTAPGAAAATQQQTVTATVAGSGLNFITSAINNATSAQLTNSPDTVVTATASSAWQVVDPRGTGAAWALSFTATNFVSEDLGASPAYSHTLAASILGVSAIDSIGTDSSIVGLLAADGTTAGVATSPIFATGNAKLGDGSQVLLHGLDGSVSGNLPSMGAFHFTPKFSLTIPGTAYSTVGHAAYVSTVTFTLA